MAGKAVSASLVSCMQRTSGRAYSIHSSTRESRALSEFTFQVAMRMISSDRLVVASSRGPDPSPVHDDEEEVDLAGQFPVHRGPAVTGAGKGRELSLLD